MVIELSMTSLMETNRYHTARRFLHEGRREWALAIVGELLRSGAGRPLGLRLLAEMYPKTTAVQNENSASVLPYAVLAPTRAARK